MDVPDEFILTECTTSEVGDAARYRFLSRLYREEKSLCVDLLRCGRSDETLDDLINRCLTSVRENASQ